MINAKLKHLKSYIIKFAIISLSLLFIVLSVKDLFSTQKVDVPIKNSQITELTKEQKLEDFNYIYGILSESYPFFQVEKRKFDYDWLSNKSQFEAWISSTKNNNEFYTTMNNILSLIQNGHTHIISPDFYDELYLTYKQEHSSSWKDVIYNKQVEKCYDYWKNNLEYNSYYIPLYFTYIEGKYYILSINEEYKDYMIKNDIPEGSLLSKVNNQITDDYVKSLMKNQSLTYDSQHRKFMVKDLTLEGENNSKISITLLTPEGKEIERVVEGIPYKYNYSAIDANKANSKNVNTAVLNNKAAYMRIRSFSVSHVKEDENIIKSFISSIRDYPYLIIDIRSNSGGSYEYWINNIVRPLASKQLEEDFYIGFRGGQYMTNYLEESIASSTQIPASLLPQSKNYPPEVSDYNIFVRDTISIAPNLDNSFHGKIFLLVDNEVYSAADAFASFSKYTNWATLIGTPTGGDGIGFDPAYAALPNSGLLVRFSFGLGLNPDGTINEETATTPDIFVEPSYSDLIQFLKHNNTEVQKDSGYIYDTILKKALELAK